MLIKDKKDLLHRNKFLYVVRRVEEKTHIIPSGFELDRILWGLESYGVTKLYLIRSISELEQTVEHYVELLKQRYYNLVEENRFKEVFIDTFNLGEIFNVAKSIIEKEGLEGQVFVNISTSTKLLALGLVIATWCADLSKMRYPPVIYYVKPLSYVHVDLFKYKAKLDELLKDEELRKEDAYALLKEIDLYLKKLLERGYAWGRDKIISIPFMPIKLPSEFEMRILAILENYGGEVGKIEHLVEALDPEKELKRRSKHPNRALRSKIAYHLKNLETRQLIQKIPSKRGVKVRITELGKVFITPRLLRKIEEES